MTSQKVLFADLKVCALFLFKFLFFIETGGDLPPVREPVGKMAGIPGYMMPGRC